MVRLKKSCLTNCDKILKFVKMGVPIFSGASCMLHGKSCKILHCCWSMTGLPISERENCQIILGFKEKWPVRTFG